MDLFSHSAGANLAVLYAARYPGNLSKLALFAPSTRAVGITITGELRRGTALLRKNEPWFPPAYAALEAVTAGEGTDDDWEAIAPFFWGRWYDEAQTNHAAASEQRNDEAAGVFASEDAFDPEATRAALLACAAPALLLAGEFDLNSPPQSTAEFAGLFPDATLVVQQGAGHYPWLDDAERFVATTATFLG
jgi:pimeloyl-ACP methyl ester carboxylesterase